MPSLAMQILEAQKLPLPRKEKLIWYDRWMYGFNFQSPAENAWQKNVSATARLVQRCAYCEAVAVYMSTLRRCGCLQTGLAMLLYVGTC